MWVIKVEKTLWESKPKPYYINKYNNIVYHPQWPPKPNYELVNNLEKATKFKLKRDAQTWLIKVISKRDDFELKMQK